MNIIEVRDGFIKFEADDSVFLSSFVQIDDDNKKYVAQVMQIRDMVGKHIANAKILFLFDGTLQPYDKTLPSADSEIKEFTFNILNNSINAKNPVIAGMTPQKAISIIVDASTFDKKMVASIDDKKNNNILVRNFSKQFNNVNKNVVIIDTLGVVEANKYIAGVDFKLPLDTQSLAFMYEDCLNDATSDSKSMIVDIFKDLAEYSKTVPFVPFRILKSIVDELVDKSHVFKLLVLKNKLAKFDRLGYFAADNNEVVKIDKILDAKCSVIDLSKLDQSFQNRYLAYLYEKLESKKDVQVILELSNTTSKKNLKKIMQNEQVSTMFITHSKFKYLNDIKNFFDNFIIEPSTTNNQIFKVYNSFLSSMNKSEYLIAGESVNYIPLVSQTKIIEEVIPTPNLLDEKKEQIVENLTTDDFVENTSNEEPVQKSDEVLNEIIALPASPVIQTDNVEGSTEEITEDEGVQQQEELRIPEEPEVTKEEILENIEQKSDAVISELTKETLTPPTVDMFSDSEDEQISVDDLQEESDDVEDLGECDNELANELEDDSELSNVEEITEIDLESNSLENEEPEIADTSIEQINAPDELEEAHVEEILMDGSALDSEYEEISDFAPEEIRDDEIVEQIPMVEQFDNEISDNLELSELEMDSQEIEEYHSEEGLQEDDVEIEVPDEIDLDLEASAPVDDLSEEQSPEEQSPEETPLEDVNSEEVIPLDDNSDFEELVELDPADAGADDIIVDFAEDEQQPEIIDEQIVKDVDKVFTTRKDDDISDSVLDFIDELNSDDNEELLQEVSDSDGTLEELASSEEDGILEEPQETIDLKAQDDNDDILETKNSSTPIVPVYDADIPQEDMVMSDPIQQGDSVIHAKYGSGVVEKMIKYGNKTLFSINFDNIGRRLLDPTLTEIKKA